MVAVAIIPNVRQSRPPRRRSNQTGARKGARPKRKPFAKKKNARNLRRSGPRALPTSQSSSGRNGGAARMNQRRPRNGRRKQLSKVREFISQSVEPSPLFTPVVSVYEDIEWDNVNSFLTFLAADILMKTDAPSWMLRSPGSVVCHPGLKWHLLRYCFAHWLDVGSIRSTDAPLIYQTNRPSGEGAVPTALAKFLEYCGPFKDKLCGTEAQVVVNLPENDINVSSCSMVDTGANDGDLSYAGTTDWGLREEPFDAGSGTEMVWSVDTGTLAYEDIDGFFETFDRIIRESGVQFTEFKNIPKRSPDASLCAEIIKYSSGGTYAACELSEFDPEVTAMFHGLNASTNTMRAFVKPFPTYYFPVNPPSLTSSAPRFQVGAIATLNQCRWAPGKIKKTLLGHPASGIKKRALKSIYPTLRRINFGQIGNLVATVASQIMENRISMSDMNPNLFPYTDADKLYDLYFTLVWYLQSPIITRIINTSGVAHFMYNVSGAERLAYVGKQWISTPLPVPVLDIVSQIGPVVFDGRLVLPIGYLGQITSGLLQGLQEFVEMSHNRDFGATTLATRPLMGNFSFTPSTTPSRPFNFFDLSVTRANAGYDPAGSTFGPLLPRKWQVQMRRALSMYKLTDQFLSEKIPLMGGNTMLMSLSAGGDEGTVDVDIEYGETGSLAYLIEAKVYRLITRISAAMPLSREDLGRGIVYCPFLLGNSDAFPILTGAVRLDINVDHFDAVSQLVEETMSDSGSVFNRALSSDLSRNKNNVLYAYRSAMGPIFANLFPEASFTTDSPLDNWKKLKCNLHIGAAPYNSLPFFDATKYGSPALYEHLKSFLNGGPAKIRAGYRKFKKLIGHDIPGEINDFTNAWVQLIGEAGKAGGTVGAVSAALA